MTVVELGCPWKACLGNKIGARCPMSDDEEWIVYIVFFALSYNKNKQLIITRESLVFLVSVVGLDKNP